MKIALQLRTALLMMTLTISIATAQSQKKSSVKVEYDKFKDATCGTVNLGDIVPWKHFASQPPVFFDASYCSRGQTLDPPTRIQLRLRSTDTTWLSAGMRTPTMSITFLLDSNERLTLPGKYEYVADKRLGGISQVIIDATTEEINQLVAAKVLEFQIADEDFKLKQKDLTKLKDLVGSDNRKQ